MPALLSVMLGDSDNSALTWGPYNNKDHTLEGISGNQTFVETPICETSKSTGARIDRFSYVHRLVLVSGAVTFSACQGAP